MNLSSIKAINSGLLIGLLYCMPLQAIRLMSADVAADSEVHATFANSIEHALFTLGGTLFTSSADKGALGYTISRLAPDNESFNPLIAPKLLPSRIVDPAKEIKKEDLKDNPIFDAAIAHLGLLNAMADLPVVVLKQDMQRVYILDKYPHDDMQFVHDSGPLLDASINPAPAEIINLTTTKTQSLGFIFLAVKSLQGVFGDVGSGIAVVRIIETKKKQETTTPEGIKKETEHVTLTVEQTCAQADDERHLVRAASLDTTSSFLKIGNNIAHMDEAVAMTYDILLNRLYVALRVQAGDQEQDGACAIAVGQVSPIGQVTFRPFASDIFTTGNCNEIIGTKGANSWVSIQHLEVMHTTTLLPYLILVGGNGDIQTTKRTVCALPIADKRDKNGQRPEINDTCGLLASKHAIPRELFSDKAKRLATRVLEDHATSVNDIYTSDNTLDNAPVHVGGGPVPYGDITGLYVKRDGVYALVDTADPGKTPGIFLSQALFDPLGKIKSWTPWQRVAGTHYGVTAMHINDTTGVHTLVVKDGNQTVRNVVRTQWCSGFEQGFAPLVKKLAEIFPQEVGGIHGLFNAHPATPALQDISLLLALGRDTITLIQTGKGHKDYFRPLMGNDLVDNPVLCTQGQLTQFNPTRLLTIKGGLLDDLGPLITARIVRGGLEHNDGYLFVGGAGGLGVLRSADGAGWDASQGLADYLGGLHRNMTFDRIGSYRFVRKLTYDDHYLYVLTPTCLDRIDLHNPAFAAVRLATPDTIPDLSKHDRFFDIVVSDALALLGTTQGLYRIGNGASILHANSAQACAWTPVILPNNQGAALQLNVASPTGNACDVARGAGGMVYTLTGHRGRNISRVYRIAISGIEKAGITDSTVQAINEKQSENTPSSFIPLCTFRDSFATDGIMRLRSHNKDMYSAPTITTSSMSLLPLPLENACQITAIERNAASGVWLIAGDFGLFINE